MSFLLAWVFVFGLVIGSWLNVLILRLPHGRTLLGRSMCPACATAVRWFDLFPVFSFLFLRARCRSCRTRISWRYPLVELLAGLLAVGIASHFGFTPVALFNFVFGCALIVVTFIDYDHHLIPDVITLPGVALGVLVAGLTGAGWWSALAGAAAGAGGLWAVAILYQKTAGREGLGMGDVKLAALLGAFLGGSGVFLTILLASLAGSVAGGVLIARGRGSRTTALPFGSFLAPAGVLVLFYGPVWIQWYVLRFTTR